MNRLLKKVLAHELLKGSVLVFAGSMIGNFFAYLFHIIAGRMLKPEDYAVIASLISSLYIIGFPTAMFNTAIVRKMAALAAKSEYKKIRYILNFLFRKLSIFSVLIAIFFFLAKKPIAEFLKIDDSRLIFIIGLTYALSLVAMVNIATIQGLLKFLSYSVIQSISSILKVLITFLVLKLGFGVFGVTAGLLVTSAMVFLISLKPLAFIFKYKEEKQVFSAQAYYSLIWIGIPLIGMGLMINTDVVLVKHFFPSFDAGIYAALSTIGRVVLFATSAIVIVLLPLSTKKRESGSSSLKIFKMSQILSFFMSASILFLYLAYPKFIINLFYGKQYYAVAPYLGLIGTYFLIYNAVNLFVNFYISLKKQTVLILPVICAVIQIALITLFHNSFYQILYVMIFSISLLLMLFWIYYAKDERQS